MKLVLILVPVAAIGLTAPGAAAGPYHHSPHAAAAARTHHGRTTDERVIHASQEPLGSGEINPYATYAGPGSAVLNATVRAAREPGVTLELAPDAKETATGGPVGGPPGFDGS